MIHPSLSHAAIPHLSLAPGDRCGYCAVCGWRGDTLLPVDKVLDPSTGKINVLFRRDSGLICPPCAALWRKPKVWHRSIFLCGDRLAWPLIADPSSIKKAKPKAARDPLQDAFDRPLWRDLVRDQSWWDQERYAVLSTDGQRRVWNMARISRGDRLALVFHALEHGISELVELELPQVVRCLDAIERVYANGYSKAAINTSLFGGGNLRHALHYERMVSPLRGSPEFLFALTIAQKDEALIDDGPNTQPSVSPRGSGALAEAGVAGPPLPEAEPSATATARREGDGVNSQLSLFG